MFRCVAAIFILISFGLSICYGWAIYYSATVVHDGAIPGMTLTFAICIGSFGLVSKLLYDDIKNV
jgi:hypothetical protein